MSFALKHFKDLAARIGRTANGRILTAMLTVGALTVVVKLVATFKESVVAHSYGAGDLLDAFLIAFLLPSFAMNVVAGSFSAALIPVYVRVRDSEGREAAERLFSNVMVVGLLLLAAAALLLAATANKLLPLLAADFGAEKLELARRLFLMLLPALPLTGMVAVWGAVLNAGERFALAALAPALTSLAVVCAVFTLGSSWGVYAVALGTVVGATLEASVVGATLRRQGLSIFPRWGGMDGATWEVLRQYAPMLAGAIVMSGTWVVDQAMAARLGPGGVSTLNYGNKISAVAVGCGALAVGASVLPQFSKMAAEADWAGLRRTLKIYARVIFGAGLCGSILLVLISQPLVALLFERGAFTSADTRAVALVQSFYVLQLPFYVTGMLYVRLLSALKANHVLMCGTVISFALNISLDYLLMKRLGAPGIALATSCVYAASLCFLAWNGYRLLRRAEGRHKSLSSTSFERAAHVST